MGIIVEVVDRENPFGIVIINFAYWLSQFVDYNVKTKDEVSCTVGLLIDIVPFMNGPGVKAVF